MVDGRTLQLAADEHGKLTLDDVRELGQQITDGHALARLYADYFTPDVPKDVDALVALAVHFHAAIFGVTGLHYAGRLRAHGDDEVVVDRGRHALTGVAPWEIRGALERTLADALPSLLSDDADRVARGCAILIEGFFRAHPFLDGNGRVARLLMRVYIQRSGKFQALAFQNEGKSGRKYVGALRYARKLMREDAAAQKRDPYRYLAAWVRMHMTEVEDDIGAQ